MEIKYKKVLSSFLTIIMLFALSACSKQSEQSNTQYNEQPTQSINATTPQETVTDDENANTLVVYFSATGSTKAVAGYIVNTLNADSYEIIPEQVYTSEDLNWTESSSRVNAEHEDPNFRPAIIGELPDLSNYNTIFIGYPIWWGEAPNILRTFMESLDFSNKTIIPFCTSLSSGFGSSGETLQAFTTNANWLEGQRFSSGVNETDVVEWVNGLTIGQ